MKLANRFLQRVICLSAAVWIGMVMSPAALAQPEAVDPPGRVGRLANVTGQVWLFTPDSGEWVNATRNRPLTAGDRLSTDAGARAEVRIGSTTLRLDSGSELEVLRLDDERVSLQLHNGSLASRLRSREAAAEFDLKTAEGQFTTQRAGRYRFDRMDGTSHLTVYNGQALYEGPRSALTVNSGQRAEFWIDDKDAAQYSITEPQRDAFSAWNGERDRSDDRSVAARYVSPEMTGVEDLDRYGRWDQSPEYGSLWIPRGVASGWAPYSTGHWAWVRPWGWTWVDDAPWGFAPFHYGRWVWFRSAWCWSPGTYVARPVYAPALVAWVGGPSVSVSLSIGGGFAGPAVGWFPLAPREVYVPSYRTSPGYVQNVNVTQVTNINVTNVINAPGSPRDFSNRKFPHAVTVVPTSVMIGRQAVGPVSAQLRDTPAMRDFVQDPGRHAAVSAPTVAAPVVVFRGSDARAPASPAAGPDLNRAGPPGMRVGRPGQRGVDGVPVAQPGVSAAPVAIPSGPVIAPTTAPVVAVPQPSRQVAPQRPPVAPTAGPNISGPTINGPVIAGPIVNGPVIAGPVITRPTVTGPAAQTAAPGTPVPVPAPAPVPSTRASRPSPVPDNRAAGNAPAAGPAQPVPRAVQAERAVPDRRQHSQPAPAAPQAVPADVPRARPEPQGREEKGERRVLPRERERNSSN